jgi:hypothetical protein
MAKNDSDGCVVCLLILHVYFGVTMLRSVYRQSFLSAASNPELKLKASTLAVALTVNIMATGYSGASLAATDEEVLARFAQVTQMPLPQVTPTASGGSQLTWNTTLDLSVYRNTQSGGAVLNPNIGGNLHRAIVGSDYRRVSEGDVTAWAQAQVTQTNDIVTQRHPLLLNKVQIGYSQPGLVGAVGDLAVAHSTLGTTLPIRGAQVQKYLGPIYVSGAAGLFVEDWRSTYNKDVRTTYPREAYAVKIGTAPGTLAFTGGGIDLYATGQSFSDRVSTSPLILNPLNGAKGGSATLGAAFKYEKLALNVEAGKSRFDETGAARLKDDAFMVDASYQGDPIALRAGFNDVGTDYSTLSMVSPGTREVFGNASWRITPEFAATLDARQSRYTPTGRTAIIPPPPPPAVLPPDPFAPPIPAIVPPPKVITDSESASLSLSWNSSSIQGLSSSLTLGRAKTDQVGADSRTQSDNASLYVSYSRDGWTGGVNVTEQRNDTEGATVSDAKSTSVTVNLAKSFADSSGQRSLNVMSSYMKQWQNNSAVSTPGNVGIAQPASKGWNDRIMLTLGFNWINIGALNVAGYLGHLKDPVSGALGKQDGVQVDAAWQMNPKWSFKLYGRENRNWQALSAQAYKDRSVGASLVGAF